MYLELEPLKWQTLLSIAVMMIGLGVAVLSAKHISFYGVLLCMAASLSAGLRWVLMHYYMKHEMKGNSVMAMLYKISPIAFLSLLPVAIGIEGYSLSSSSFFDDQTTSLPLQAVFYSIFGGVLASTLIFTEMVILNATSSLTLMVLGQAKEVIQIILGMFIFNENLSLRSIIGITFSLLAANNYRKIKVTEIAEEASLREADNRDQDGSLEMLLTSKTAMNDMVNQFLMLCFY